MLTLLPFFSLAVFLPLLHPFLVGLVVPDGWVCLRLIAMSPVVACGVVSASWVGASASNRCWLGLPSRVSRRAWGPPGGCVACGWFVLGRFFGRLVACLASAGSHSLSVVSVSHAHNFWYIIGTVILASWVIHGGSWCGECFAGDGGGGGLRFLSRTCGGFELKVS